MEIHTVAPTVAPASNKGSIAPNCCDSKAKEAKKTPLENEEESFTLVASRDSERRVCIEHVLSSDWHVNGKLANQRAARQGGS